MVLSDFYSGEKYSCQKTRDMFPLFFGVIVWRRKWLSLISSRPFEKSVQTSGPWSQCSLTKMECVIPI